MFNKSEEQKAIETIDDVMPSVVSVVISKKFEELKKDVDNISNPQSTLSIKDIPKENIDAKGNVEIGGGSGFIVDKSGIILTNRHVIAEPDTSYKVILSDGEEFDAKVLARDPMDDIAILKIDPEDRDIPKVHLGNSDSLKLGQSVLAFGNVMGRFQNTVSKGIVSGLSRSIKAKIDSESPSVEMRGLIQTDAAINPGNSGGPLTDTDGNVVGINVAVASGVQNVGFALPVKLVERDLADLKRFGEIKRPFLGVRYITINENIAEKHGFSNKFGALVTQGDRDSAVVEDSPAEQAGIREGDIILKWNDDKVFPKKTIRDYLSESEVGDKPTLTILRDDKSIDVEVELKERK